MSYQDKYKEVYGRLLTETATIVFIKADGTIRTMLSTKNMRTTEVFGYDRPLMTANMNSHDKRCSISNDNISVIDLIIGEGRSFNIQRLVSIHWYGEVETKERADEVYKDFKEFNAKYKESRPTEVSMDDLQSIDNI